MKFVQRLRNAWRSFSVSFDYEPPNALAPTQPADTVVMESPPITPPAVDMATAKHPPEVQAELDRIAKAGPEDLPPIVTRPMRRADGSWYLMIETISGHLREPNVIELAVMARAKQLREAPSTPYSPPAGDSRFTVGPM